MNLFFCSQEVQTPGLSAICALVLQVSWQRCSGGHPILRGDQDQRDVSLRSVYRVSTSTIMTCSETDSLVESHSFFIKRLFA